MPTGARLVKRWSTYAAVEMGDDKQQGWLKVAEPHPARRGAKADGKVKKT